MPKKEKLPKQAKHEKQQKKRKGRSVQDFIGVKTFTKYGLMTQKGELLFYLVSPTNISVLSYVNIEIKIRHLMMVLSSIPDIEITCTDSSECFDDNKAYLHERLEYEQNPKVRKLIKKDIEFLDNVQVEMATARQFLFTARIKASKDKQVFDTANRVEKIISEQGFEVRRMRKADIKRFLALYFEASMNGEQMPDIDGEQFYEVDEDAEYQLGKIYLYGKEVERDYEKAIAYLSSAAEHGNQYAEQLLHSIQSNRNWSAALGVVRLLHHLSRMIQNQLDDEKKGKTGAIDRKLKRKIDEKKQAHGLKQG